MLQTNEVKKAKLAQDFIGPSPEPTGDSQPEIVAFAQVLIV
jgi:hypothetical protein